MNISNLSYIADLSDTDIQIEELPDNTAHSLYGGNDLSVCPSKTNSVNPQPTATFPGFLPEFGFSSLVYCLPGPGPGGFQCVFLG